jgi:peptide/nickel transport system permease protein
VNIQTFSLTLFATLAGASLLAGLLPHHSYEDQFRDAIDAPPSPRFWLGTDSLGRDRWSRLIFGTRVSLLLASSAAALSVALATLAGASSGYLGGGWNVTLLSLADVFLCVPWFFLLTAIRGVMPLNTGPLLSAVITFVLLGLLGWAGPARILSIRTRRIMESDYIRQARAAGVSPGRVLLRQVVPNLMPIVFAQFWILVPAYILAEANLGVLGLGVSEPLPSWGSLLRELESAANWGSWRILLPMMLLGLVAGTLQLAFQTETKR